MAQQRLRVHAGRVEFAGYLPANTQAVVVQPVGSEGVVVAGGDTQRGFRRLDQAWLSSLADKLEVELEAVSSPRPAPQTARANS